MGTDFTSPRAMKIANDLKGLRRAAHGVVEDIGRSDPISFEDPLHMQQGLDGRDAHCPTGPLAHPVELGFSIDHDDDQRRVSRRPIDHFPGVGVEHAHGIVSSVLLAAAG